jgi:acyl-CoA hydrolase
METYCFVRPEHLNHHGFLFGGQLLKWIDEYAWLAATREFPGTTLVTRAMDEILFRKRVCNGAILRFDLQPCKIGSTSVTYCVEVFASDPGTNEEEFVFSTHITFVNVDDKGIKASLPQRKIPHVKKTSTD